VKADRLSGDFLLKKIADGVFKLGGFTAEELEGGRRPGTLKGGTPDVKTECLRELRLRKGEVGLGDAIDTFLIDDASEGEASGGCGADKFSMGVNPSADGAGGFIVEGCFEG